MKNESISLDELSNRANTRRQCCQEAEGLCQRQCACVFTLTTALLLQGIEVPAIDVRKHPRLGEDVLQVAVGPDEYKPRDHVRGNRRKRAKSAGLPYAFFASGVPLDTVEVAPGITCTTPIFTWFLFATRLSLEELVVLGDACCDAMCSTNATRCKTLKTCSCILGTAPAIRAAAGRGRPEASRHAAKHWY